MPVDYSKYKEAKARRQRREMLAEWYGMTIANTEVIAYGPQLRPISSIIDAISRDIFSDEVRHRIELEGHWAEIAGKQLAALTHPGGFLDGRLNVEVRHAAFLRELDGTRDLLRSRVNQFLGGDICKEIRFVASSGRKR